MAIIPAPGTGLAADMGNATSPLVVLFERDDTIAVPLLSQLRMVGYDVRAARTPVELFGMLGKQLVAMVLVDLGNATAGRREFWVALDAQRRGRSLQVMTFRFISPANAFDPDFEPAARALADVEVRGIHEFQKVLDAVRQRIPLNGQLSGFAAPGMIPPIGSALGLPSPFSAPSPYNQPAAYGQPPSPSPSPYGQLAQQYGSPAPFTQPSPFNPQPSPYNQPATYSPPSPPPSPYGQFAQQYSPPSPYGQPAPMPYSEPSFPPYTSNPQASPFAQPLGGSPFAQPVPANPFSGGHDDVNSPFAQPYNVNPFAGGGASPAVSSDPRWDRAGMSGMAPATNPYGQPLQAEPFGGQRPDLPRFGASPQAQYAQQGQYGQQGQVEQFGQFGQRPISASAPMPQSGYDRDDRQVVDVWVPPEDDQVTSVVPEATFQRIERQSQNGRTDQMSQMGAALQEPTRRMPAVQNNGADYQSTPAERALSTVLVEGAMLTDQKLEALRGIQQMLTGVGMQFKLGELALLFKFLSPDQLLAALLVSRGLVSPQQIASLGRIKQELAATGKDEDLATLLLKFQILPADQLRSLQAEL